MTVAQNFRLFQETRPDHERGKPVEGAPLSQTIWRGSWTAPG